MPPLPQIFSSHPTTPPPCQPAPLEVRRPDDQENEILHRPRTPGHPHWCRNPAGGDGFGSGGMFSPPAS